jgi:site-specific recombinase XerD
MKNDFATILNKFLSYYLPSLRNVSAHTVSSYCDTFRLLLSYCRDNKGLAIEKITLATLTDDLIIEFIQWLKTERRNSISTCNQRLGAIHSFFRYAQSEDPSNIINCQRILNIPRGKSSKPIIKYLTVADTKLLLSQPDTATIKGRRDIVILSLLYDTGARVQELIDLCVRDIRLEHPARIILTGKGRKSREVPLLSGTVSLLKHYFIEYNLLNNNSITSHVFVNHRNEPFTRNGIAYILSKYVSMSKKLSSTLPEKVTPHALSYPNLNKIQTFKKILR